MKRRDLERHLRTHGARLLREGGNHSFWGFDAERSTARAKNGLFAGAFESRQAHLISHRYADWLETVDHLCQK